MFWGERMKLNKKQITIVLIAALLLGFAGAYLGVNLAQGEQSSSSDDQFSEEKPFSSEENNESPEDMEKVSQAYSLIKKHFIEDVDDQELIEGAIQGMLTSLDDPYSTYMDVDEMEEFNEQIESSLDRKSTRLNSSHVAISY